MSKGYQLHLLNLTEEQYKRIEKALPELMGNDGFTTNDHITEAQHITFEAE